MATPGVREVVSAALAYNAGPTEVSVTTRSTGDVAQVGDLLVCLHGADDTTSSTQLTAPTGTSGTWTQQASGSHTSGGRPHLKIWSRPVAVVGAQTVTVTQPTGGSDTFVAVLVLSGSQLAVEAGGGGGGDATASQVAPSVTAVTADALLICGWIAGYGGDADYTAPAAMTKRSENDVAPFSTMATATQALTAAGATGTRIATSTSAASPYASVSVAVGAGPGDTIIDVAPVDITVDVAAVVVDAPVILDVAPVDVTVDPPAAKTVTTVPVGPVDVIVEPIPATLYAEAAGLPAGGGLSVSWWAIHPTTGVRVPLPDVGAWSLSPILNSPGSMSLSYPTLGLNAGVLDEFVTARRDIEVEIWFSGRWTGALRGLLCEKATNLVAEGASTAYGGHFLEHFMTEMVVLPDPVTENKETIFSAATPGSVVGTLMARAQAAGHLTNLTYTSFSTLTDSNGAPWSSTITANLSPIQTTYLAVLDDLVEQGALEWEITPAREVRLYEPGTRGQDRTLGADPVVLRRGRNLTDVPMKVSAREGGTDLWGVGADGLYHLEFDATARALRGRQIARSFSANGIKDAGALDAATTARLPAVTAGRREVTHGILFGAGDPLPVAGFGLGDWVFSNTGQGSGLAGGGNERLRIRQWTLSCSEAGEYTGTISLGDLFDEQLVQIARQLARLQGGQLVVGTSIAPPEGVDTMPPAAPAGVVVSSSAYQDGANEPTWAAIFITWSAVTQNFDGTAITDLAGYRARYRYRGLVQTGGIGEPGEYIPGGGDGRWNETADVAAGVLTVQESGVESGAAIEVQVAAFDTEGNVSAWSAGALHTTAKDNQSPPVASTPATAFWFTTLDVTWNGLGAAGEAMPADSDGVKVHISTTNNFTPDATTLKARLYTAGTWNEPGLPHGVGHYARLVAVDKAGNEAAPSATSPVATASQLVGQDLIDSIVTAPKIADFAVQSAKIADLAVVNGKIANLAVNSAKVAELNAGLIITGTMTAVVTLSGIIQTASSGQRMRIDGSGWKAYLASGTIFAELNIPNGSMLVTGEIRTGLSGQRVQMLMDGTMLFYPAAGSNYSLLANNGNELYLRGPLNGASQSGQSFYWASGVGLAFGLYPTALNSRLSVGDRLISQQQALLVHVLDGRFNPADGTARRVLWKGTNSSGVDIATAFLHLFLNDRPHLFSPDGDIGIKWDGAQISILKNNLAYGQIGASAFVTNSALALKTPPTPARFRGRSAVGVGRTARAQRWHYLDDLLARPTRPGHDLYRHLPDGTSELVGPAEWSGPAPIADVHVGPIADELLAVAPELVRRGPEGNLALDIGTVAGMAWAMGAENGDAVEDIRAELAELRRLLGLAPRRQQPMTVDGEVLA